MPVSEAITRAFTSGATILTANVRAARWLKREYALAQSGIGRRAWVAPAIEDWDSWVRNQWQKRALADADAALLLTSLQERSVWRRMQREDSALLVSPASMAALAEGAYALLSNYDAGGDREHEWGRTDAERFRQWASNFDRECARRNWISSAGLELRVAAWLDPEVLPREILLVGFERMSPAQEGLLRALVESGVSVQAAEAGILETETEFIRATGQREEIEAAAWWVRSRVEKDPDARIGILVPDLSAMRSEIERIFRRVLAPSSDDIFADHAMPFEFSLGQPLAHVPAIRAALLLLGWLDGPLREEEVSWLLLSGFLSSGDDYLSTAKLDAKHRDSGSLSLEITLEEFLRRSEKFRLPLLMRLENARKMAEANRFAQKARLPGRRVDLAQRVLREAGWPGATEQGRLHFQVLRRWEHALDEIALLNFDGQDITFNEFLRMLEAHALETIFSPESHGAPVQIMGALEASGQQFDALWFLSADDTSWPPRGRPHPLLPNDLQRRFRMPYADAEIDLELAKAVTAHIAGSAPVVVFSYSEGNQDGELRPSPLLSHSAQWKRAHLRHTPIDHTEQSLEEIEDASECIAWPEDRAAGGSEVLKYQAACPFQAFAMKRLHAEPLNRSDWGFSAAERGVLLHRTLERIWSPSAGALHSLSDLQSAIGEGWLTSILRSAIVDVFADFSGIEDPWMRAYLSSEQRRLQRRLEQWMKIEAERVPFTVEACEEELKDVGVGGLKLRLRADRIDRVSGSDRLLIDYKTGEVSPKDWEPPRPNEPQLPLYAVFGNVRDVCGVLFAQIRAGKMCFSGNLTDARSQLCKDAIPNSSLMKDTYNESMRAWEDALLVLAAEFLRGEAAVDPKERRKTCEYCPLPGMCRVAEMRDPLEELAEGNGSDE